MAQTRSPNWEREPLRWLAVRYMQNAFLRIDEATKSGRPRPKDAALALFSEDTELRLVALEIGSLSVPTININGST